MSIVVVGSVALDTIETPDRREADVLGGSASYFALAAQHFSEVQMVAVVGKDFPEENEKLFVDAGVDTDGLHREEGRTFRWSGRYSADLTSRDTLATELNVFATFHPELTESQQNADTVFLANIDPDLQLEVLDQVRDPKLVACDTMNLWIDTKRETLLELLRRVDIVFLNDEEARQLAGEYQLPRAAREILRMGIRQLVIKKGENGALYFSSKDVFFCPAYPQEALVDTTGAGDAFAGGVLGYLDHLGAYDQPPLRAALVTGAAMASLSVEDFSPRKLSEISRDEIADRVEAVRALTHVPDVPLWRTRSSLADA